MRLVMAVSADGYVARTKNDDMSWTGDDDKNVFRVLTSVGGVVGVSSVTRALMPKTLQGRALLTLSRHGLSAKQFANAVPGSWLAGGPTVALSALRDGLVSEVHLCRSTRCAYPEPDGVRDMITSKLHKLEWRMTMQTAVGDTVAECWRPY